MSSFISHNKNRLRPNFQYGSQRRASANNSRALSNNNRSRVPTSSERSAASSSSLRGTNNLEAVMDGAGQVQLQRQKSQQQQQQVSQGQKEVLKEGQIDMDEGR
jgi:hypothetical protein